MSTAGDDGNLGVWRIVVTATSESLDARGREALGDMHRSGFTNVGGVRASRIYLLHGRLDADTVDDLARTLLCDRVAETCVYVPDTPELVEGDAVVETHYQPGVMDPVALSARRALNGRIKWLGLADRRFVNEVRTAWAYVLTGVRDADELDRIARGVLANDCIATVYVRGFGRHDRRPVELPAAPMQPFEPRTVPLRGLDGAGLERLAREAHLFLSRAEMETIRDHFRDRDRDPTDLELETLAQTWSEHCVHKTLRSEVLYCGDDFGKPGRIEVRFDNLLKDTIARATAELNRDWCLSVFEDNAGIITFDDEYGIAVKVETHNHPSAIEPYGGAATGIGGCIRDIMGCGLGAKPIASTDVFCVADPDYAAERLPRGVLHPARVLKGIVAGVRDYGNRMGIPTVNGAVCFDDRYLGNPLVFCGSIGLIPRDRIQKAAHPGDHIVVLGGRTGRDGIHGATFSSAELTEDHADEFSHAVQIGNAIEEKRVLDAMLLARDHASGCLYRAVTDCGAGGLSSAVGEMGEKLGAEVDLERVPLKYAGLRHDEIWISEAQERMVLAVPPENLDAVLAICTAEDVEATVIGTFTDDRRLVVRYEGTVVGDLEMEFLHHGLPKSTRSATWTRPAGKPAATMAGTPGAEPSRDPGGDRGGSHLHQAVRTSDDDTACHRRIPAGDAPAAAMERELLERLSTYNIASKEWVIRQYDHEVQGGSVVKPLCGPGEGPGDAAVVRPRLDRQRGIAIGCGLCPRVSDDDPYVMSLRAVDEALRNVICVGANPVRVAILDNFCWGGCDTPEAMGTLVRACKGAYDVAVAYGLPFISGKDSLNNQFSQDPAQARLLGLPELITIPGTLLISAVGMVEDVRSCVSMDLKRPGNPLVLVARPVDCMGFGSAYEVHRAVAAQIACGAVRAAHDISDGGLTVCLAEMCLAGELGARVEVDAAYGVDVPSRLFEEYATGYVLECESPDALAAAGGVYIGEVTEAARLVMVGGGETLVDLEVERLAGAWRQPLSRRISGEAGV